MQRSSIIIDYLDKNRSYFLKKDSIKEPLNSSIDISVVIPAYNDQICLQKLLLSLDLQTYRNFEVIVVDNNSIDQTKEIVMFCQKRVNYPLYKITEFRKGVANARKRGMDEVLFRVAEAHNHPPIHLIATTDTDSTPPNNWLETIHLKGNGSTSLALAGTHQADSAIDLAIERKLQIKNYFNFIPLMIESLYRNNIGVIKMSGPNSVFEIEAYAAGGGIKQEYDEVTGLVNLSEVNALGKRIQAQGYLVMPLGIRVITSKRRQLREILSGESSYFPIGFLDKDRFNVIREDENELLQLALEGVNKNDWLKYREKMITVVLNNLISSSLPTSAGAMNFLNLNMQIGELAVNFAEAETFIIRDLKALITKQFGIVL